MTTENQSTFAAAGDARRVPEQARRPTKLPGWLLALVLLAETFLAYAPVWRAGFLWDDDVLLTGNRLVQSPDGLKAIWFSTESPDYFPMTSTALWLEWRLWGANPLGYHLANLFLHALGAVLLWRVLLALKIPGAWLAAAIFAVHPVNVESVAWISEHKNTLALVFALLSLLAWLRFEESVRWQWYTTSLVAFVFALLSKTAVVPLPFVLLGIAAWRHGRVTWRDFARTIPFFAAAGVLTLVTLWFHHHRAVGSAVIRTDGFWSRFAGAGWALWFYLYKAVLPVNLAFIYPRWRIEPANLLSYIPALLAFLGLGWCWLRRRDGGRAWLFALGVFVLLLLPVLGFLTISFMRYSFVADRWQYFAIIGPITLIAAALAIGRHVSFMRAVSVALLLTLGVLTWRQSATFTDHETIWRATLARNPKCAVAETYLGNVLMRTGRSDEAFVHYQKALELEPADELAHYNFGYALLEKGHLDEAVMQFHVTLAIQPDSVPAHFQLGNALERQGRNIQALEQFQKTVELAPQFTEGQSRLGDLLLQQGRADEAAGHYQQALRIQPRSVNASLNLGIALFQQGKRADAVTHFRAALEIEPNSAEAHINLASAFLQMGNAREALPHYRSALALQPDDHVLLADTAWLLATCPDVSLRNGAEAEALALKANRLTGNRDPVTLRTLAAAKAESKKFNEAVETARCAIAAMKTPSDATFANELRAELARYEAGCSATGMDAK